MIIVAVVALVSWLILIPEISNEGSTGILKLIASLTIGATVGHVIGFDLFKLIKG